MKILFTGASSFTGCSFVRQLAAAGHEVWATFRRPPGEYAEPLRRRRVREVLAVARPLSALAFGEPAFISAIAAHGPWDLLCHHGADAGNYKSPEFDVAAAWASNTHRLPRVLEALRDCGCQRVLLTGSIFEPGEGAGSQGLPAFSPYGLSKGLTAEAFKYYADVHGFHLGKFVIPNPFGPLEEPRFTSYLARVWLAGETAVVKTPAYVRDNVHVSLLARAYVAFAEQLGRSPGFQKHNPSQYVETQGAFAQRFAAAMTPRLGVECALELPAQVAFDEPRIRLNTDMLDPAALHWDEQAAWDELAAFYLETYAAQAAAR